MEGYRRILAKRTKKKEPVTAQNLRDIIRNTDMSDLTSVRTAAVCLLSFAAFLRFDELTKLNCNDVKFYDGSMALMIRGSKTDQYRQGDEVLVSATETDTCPVAITRRYIELGDVDLSSPEPFFRGIVVTKKGQCLRPQGRLSYTRTQELVREAIQKAGLAVQMYGLHRLRAGGATAAANAGVPDRAFKRHGRWKSETAKDGYVKDSTEYRLSVSKQLGL